MIPPRVAAWLLARCLNSNDRAEVLGDLAEDFVAYREVHGVAASRRWYWRQALALAWSLGRRTGAVHSSRSRLMMLDELRYSLRRSMRQPWFTLASVLTLACAIGAVVATWSLLSATLIHPLNVNDPSRLTVVAGRYQSSPTSSPGPLSFGLTYSGFEAVRSSDIFADVAGSGTGPNRSRSPAYRRNADSNLFPRASSTWSIGSCRREEISHRPTTNAARR